MQKKKIVVNVNHQECVEIYKDFLHFQKKIDIRVAGFIWSQNHLENTLQKEIALHRVQDGEKCKCRESVTRTVSASNFWGPAKGENLFEITAYGLEKTGFPLV